MATLFTLPRSRAFDNSADPLPGALLYFYATGTSTPQAVYSDADLNVAHENPVQADAYGTFPAIFLAAATYRVTLTDAGGVTLWTDDGVSGSTTSGGGGGDEATWPATADEIANSITVVDETFPPFDVRRYGAAEDETPATNTTAIQAALDLAYLIGGGTVVLGQGEEYQISSALTMGSFTNLDGRGGQLTQMTANVPILKMTKTTLNQHLTVRDIKLHYSAEQLSTHLLSTAVLLAEVGKLTWHVLLENVKIRWATNGVYLPPDAGGSAFLVNLTNVVCSDCSAWGFLIEGNPSGANTNYYFNTCWVIQSTPDEISTSKGFAIKRTHGFRMDNCGADHVQNGNILYVETCQGSIGTFWAESCDLEATVYGDAWFTFSNSVVDVSCIYTYANAVNLATGSTFFAVRSMDGSRVHLSALYDIDTVFSTRGLPGGDRKVVYCDSISTLTNDHYASSTVTGVGGTKLGEIVDNNTGIGVKRWNNQSLEYNVCDAAHSNSFNLGGMDATPFAISMRWAKSGQNVTLRWGYKIDGTGQGTHIGIATLPAVIRPVVTQRTFAFIYCEDASPYQRLGMVEIQTDGEIRIYKDLEGNTFPIGVTCGVLDTAVSYNLVGDEAPNEIV